VETPLRNQIRLYQVDSFTTTRFKGNPAGVVPNADGLSDDQMQAIARELNNSETAFILSPTAPDHDVWIRFFTPSTEVPSCGHATVAAHYVRALENKLPSCTVRQRIGIGILPVGVLRKSDDYVITMTQGRPEFDKPISQAIGMRILDALGLSSSDRDQHCPIQVASTGHSKILVGIQSPASLHNLDPDMQSLAGLSAEIGSNGFYVFALDLEHPEIQAHGRMFAPAIGINEDPVTGNANGPLGAYLVHHGLIAPGKSPYRFRARQGEAMGRPGVVDVEVESSGNTPTLVRVGGRAIIAFKATLELS
jgi:PhzF family phenazine biosynthesis protein